MWTIERAAARWSIRLTSRGTAQRGSGRLGSEFLELAGLLDWMNLTGPPLKGLLREFKIKPDNLILIHDDLDLEPGRLRIKHGGGAGGQGVHKTRQRLLRERRLGAGVGGIHKTRQRLLRASRLGGWARR
jgi:PTH1 family peptidyl-tRNA hydrolase